MKRTRTYRPIFSSLIVNLVLIACVWVDAALAGEFKLHPLSGTVYSVGEVDTNHAGNGGYIGVDFSNIVFNGGIEQKKISGTEIYNAYGGIGAFSFVKIQLGYGNKGFIRRVRHDLNLARVIAFVTQRFPKKPNLLERITFIFAAEKYNNDSQLDNVQFGIGLMY